MFRRNGLTPSSETFWRNILPSSSVYTNSISTVFLPFEDRSVCRLNCCWPSPAQFSLSSVSSRSMTKIFILS
jgi:hypothetical protein